MTTWLLVYLLMILLFGWGLVRFARNNPPVDEVTQREVDQLLRVK